MKTRCLPVFFTLFFLSGLRAEESAATPKARMTAATGHYLDSGGEVSRMTMVQKNAEGKVLRTHELLLATLAEGDRFQTVIHVLNDGTVFFADQLIRPEEPENQSWMYVPPIPGVKNSGKVFAVNQRTLQQPFIGSGFDVVDLERINVHDGETYSDAETTGWIRALSERYGEREIRLDAANDIQEIRYFRRGREMKRSQWLSYTDHRPGRIRMERLRKGEVVHITEIELTTQRGVQVPPEVFDRRNLRRAKRALEELAETLAP